MLANGIGLEEAQFGAVHILEMIGAEINQCDSFRLSKIIFDKEIYVIRMASARLLWHVNLSKIVGSSNEYTYNPDNHSALIVRIGISTVTINSNGHITFMNVPGICCLTNMLEDIVCRCVEFRNT